MTNLHQISPATKNGWTSADRLSGNHCINIVSIKRVLLCQQAACCFLLEVSNWIFLPWSRRKGKLVEKKILYQKKEVVTLLLLQSLSLQGAKRSNVSRRARACIRTTVSGWHKKTFPRLSQCRENWFQFNFLFLQFNLLEGGKKFKIRRLWKKGPEKLQPAGSALDQHKKD